MRVCPGWAVVTKAQDDGPPTPDVPLHVIWFSLLWFLCPTSGLSRQKHYQVLPFPIPSLHLQVS